MKIRILHYAQCFLSTSKNVYVQTYKNSSVKYTVLSTICNPPNPAPLFVDGESIDFSPKIKYLRVPQDLDG